MSRSDRAGRRSPLASLLLALAMLMANAGCGGPRRTPAAPTPPLAGLVAVVDPGHGGVDGGATRAGVAEKGIVLAVSLKLAQELRQRGATVYLTRETDVEPGRGAPDPYMEDLRQRVRLARREGAQVFLSVHADVARRPVRGATVLIDTDSDAGLRLSRLLAERLAAATGSAVPIARQDLYVLRMLPDVAAAVIEVGFLSHPQDLRLLVDPAYQARLAGAIADAVEAYWRE